MIGQNIKKMVSLAFS